MRLAPGVVGFADAPDPWFRDAVGQLLANRDSVLSHRSAAHLHGFGLRSTTFIELTLPHGARDPHAAHAHRTRLDDVDIINRRGLRTTTASRTLCDLATVATSDDNYRWVVEDALVRGLCRPGPLRATAARLATAGRPGASRRRSLMTRLFDGTTFVPLSLIERRFAELAAERRINGIEFGFRPPWFDGVSGVVDAAIPAARLVIELDGRRWHTMSERFEQDRARDRQAAMAGWRVLRFTWSDVFDRPDEVVASIRRAVAVHAA